METSSIGGAQVELPRYQCHKKVHAFKIKGIEPKEDGGAVLTHDEAYFIPVTVSAEYMSKHNPQVGGYYVVYQDGYLSFSPAEAFEGGYTRI